MTDAEILEDIKTKPPFPSGHTSALPTGVAVAPLTRWPLQAGLSFSGWGSLSGLQPLHCASGLVSRPLKRGDPNQYSQTLIF